MSPEEVRDGYQLPNVFSMTINIQIHVNYSNWIKIRHKLTAPCS